MKVILNKDLNPLGEEGDVKDVAKGYARNYLFPRGIALPYTEKTIKLFESRREAIDARKEEKRKDALGIKEKLEGLDLILTMPAGANGRLYGAVTSQTIADELVKQGFPVERKRVEVQGNTFKSVGKYKVAVKLYESAAAEVSVSIQAQPVKVETKAAPVNKSRRRRDAGGEAEQSSAGAPDAVPENAVEALEAPVEIPPTEAVAVPPDQE